MTKAELDSIKILPLEDSWYRKVKEKLDGIAKPLDGLGKFEHLIAQIGAIEKTTKISIQKKAVLVMCRQWRGGRAGQPEWKRSNACSGKSHGSK